VSRALIALEKPDPGRRADLIQASAVNRNGMLSY